MGARHPVCTIGHSTRSIPEFTALLGGAGVNFVVDVRTVPRSRTNPQFNADTLPATLAAAGIGYRHIRVLGGLRKRRSGDPASPNSFWQNASFRNYADYAATPAFREGLAELLDLARNQVCAVMCAEAVWWRCHRRMIADYLIVAGAEVWHIMGPGRTDRASLTSAAVPAPDGSLVYASET